MFTPQPHCRGIGPIIQIIQEGGGGGGGVWHARGSNSNSSTLIAIVILILVNKFHTIFNKNRQVPQKNKQVFFLQEEPWQNVRSAYGTLFSWLFCCFLVLNGDHLGSEVFVQCFLSCRNGREACFRIHIRNFIMINKVSLRAQSCCHAINKLRRIENILPRSLPNPDCLKPPNGAATSVLLYVLIKTVPA